MNANDWGALFLDGCVPERVPHHLKPCPSCSGDGTVREESDGSHREIECWACNGLGTQAAFLGTLARVDFLLNGLSEGK